MKCSDIMLSVMLHAGIVAGVMYGISHYENDPVEDEVVEPMFFEILEESVIAAASAPVKQDEQETPLPKDESQVSEPEEVEPDEPEPEPMPKQEATPEPAPEALEKVKENNPPEPEPTPPEPLPSHPPPQPEESDPMPPETSPPEQAAVPEIAPQADQEVAKVVSEPAAIGRIVPKYPRSARRRGKEGAVTLEIRVSDSGKVSDTTVVSSSGHRDLDAAAVSAVRSAQFAPATEDGVKVEGRVRLTFEFRLR